MADTRIFLTTTGTGTWTVPADCTSATIETIGGGATATKYAGGGGGAYSKKNNLSLTPGESISFQVGGANQDTWFKSISDVLAKCGNGTSGGLAANGVGDVKYSGGNGHYQNADIWAGGGAAGIHGDGNSAPNYYTGGSADAGYGGNAGTQSLPDGGNGTEWDSTHGSGGGGSAAWSPEHAGVGGKYGGGGGGVNRSPSNGIGGQGLIVITYTPVVSNTSQFFPFF